MPTITREQVTAAGFTPRSNGSEESPGNYRWILCLDANGRAVAVLPASINVKTDWIGDTSVVDQNTYVAGQGYPKTLRVPFTFNRDGLTGWEWDKLTPAQQSIVASFFQHAAAIVQGAIDTAAIPAQLAKVATDEIARLRSIYSRGPSVDESHIIPFGMQTLKGMVTSQMVKANKMLRDRGYSEAFPEVHGAPENREDLLYPPPDGTIDTRADYFPIGYVYGASGSPTTNAGPWQVGAYSRFIAPVDAWRGGQSAPAPYRYPGPPRLYYGPNPTYTGVNPVTGLPNVPTPDVAPAPLSPPPITPPTGGGYQGNTGTSGTLPPAPSLTGVGTTTINPPGSGGNPGEGHPPVLIPTDVRPTGIGGEVTTMAPAPAATGGYGWLLWLAIAGAVVYAMGKGE
jgi:hypothetical protein